MNTNLFTDRQMTPEDVSHLVRCNAAIGRLSRYKKLFFALKDRLLHTYGHRDGYDLQEWNDYGFDSPCYGRDWCTCKPSDPGYMGSCDIYAWHCHILERWVLGGKVFHRPTGEFYYAKNHLPVSKESPGYSALRKACSDHIKGRKRYWRSTIPRAEVWTSLKYLLDRFGFLLDDDARMGRRARRRRLARLRRLEEALPDELPF